MPNNNTATILNITHFMSPTSDNALGFHIPMFEDIFLFSCELAASMERPPYYGDEINLGFWEKLNMEFGEPSVDNTKIVCIGNSLTYGAGAGGSDGSSSQGNNWPDIWAESTGLEIINAGINGNTSGQMLARFNTDVVANSPDYCIIECGTNDWLQNVTLTDVKSNIDSMVALCLANNIKPRFAHYSMRRNQLYLALNNGLYPAIGDVDNMVTYLEDIWQYEQGLGYPCVLFNDFTDVDENNADMYYFYNTMNDFVHPNVYGYRQWAYGIHLAFIDICTSTENDNIYTLYDGWKYKYYYNQKKFVILDENENVVLEKNDVITISDFPIDFSVHKSHQFEIIISDSSGVSTFYIPTKLEKKIYGESPIVNNGNVTVINNVYMPNYFKPRQLGEEENKKPVIVAIGSSATAPHPQQNIEYPAWTSRFEEVSGYTMINVGIDGNVTGQMLERFWTDVISIRPDYCIMEVGINDTRAGDTHPLDSTKREVHSMANLCEINGIVPIFIVPIPPYNLDIPDYAQIGSYRARQNELKTYIESLGYTVYPYYDALETSTGYINLDYTYDGVHANSEGNKLIGDMLYTYLDDLEKEYDYDYVRPDNPLVVVIGDSISAGAPFTDNKPGDYPNDWASWTAKFRELTGYRVINQAIGGTTNLQTRDRFMSDVVALNPDYVIVEHGNDCVFGISNFSTTTATYLDDIIQMCEDNNIKLIFIQPVARFNMTDYGSASVLPDYIQYMHMMHEYQTTEGYPCLVGYYTPISIFNEGIPSDTVVDQSMLADGVHPTLVGYEIVGEWLTSQLLDAMSERVRVEYPTNDLYRVEQIYADSYIKYNVIPEYKLFKYPSTISGVQGIIDIDFANNTSFTEQVYSDNFVQFHAIKRQVTFKAQMLHYSMLLAILSLTMFPMLEPILRSGEEQNNRPIYEPWLIWGVFKFLGNHEYGGPYYPWDDPDTPNIDVLDGISPNWSY